MDLWERARAFAGEAAKRSQELSAEAAKRSSALVSETAKKSKEIFSETATKSREIAAEATKQADLLAGQIKRLSTDLPVPSIPAIPPIPTAVAPEPDAAELERYGITEDLREFVKGMTTLPTPSSRVDADNLLHATASRHRLHSVASRAVDAQLS